MLLLVATISPSSPTTMMTTMTRSSIDCSRHPLARVC
jgi:hypothetical protein